MPEIQRIRDQAYEDDGRAPSSLPIHDGPVSPAAITKAAPRQGGSAARPRKAVPDEYRKGRYEDQGDT